MPNEEQIDFIAGPLQLYFVRLPDDERDITKIVTGVMLAGVHTRFLRGAMDPDSWDKWKEHPAFNEPVDLFIRVTREDPGVVMQVAALVPMRDLPREQWGPEFAGEEWKGGTGKPPKGSVGPLPIGTLVRYKAKCHHGDLMSEAMCVLKKAIQGDTVEPHEQGLSV